jgi:hypothetical protein
MGGLLSCAAAQINLPSPGPQAGAAIGTNQLCCTLGKSAAAAASSVSRSYLPVAALAFYCASGVPAARRVTTGIRHAACASRARMVGIRELLVAQARRARGRGSNLKLGCMRLWPEAATTSPGHRALPQAAVDCTASARFVSPRKSEPHSGW